VPRNQARRHGESVKEGGCSCFNEATGACEDLLDRVRPAGLSNPGGGYTGGGARKGEGRKITGKDGYRCQWNRGGGGGGGGY